MPARLATDTVLTGVTITGIDPSNLWIRGPEEVASRDIICIIETVCATILCSCDGIAGGTALIYVRQVGELQDPSRTLVQATIFSVTWCANWIARNRGFSGREAKLR